MVDGPGRLFAVSRGGSRGCPIQGAANEARLCPHHLASDFKSASIVSACEQRDDHAVVTPEVDDIMRSEPDRFVGLVQRLIDPPAQGVEFCDVAAGTGIAWVEGD